MLALLRRRVSTLLCPWLASAALAGGLTLLGACASSPGHDASADAATSDAPATPPRSLVSDGPGALRLAPLAEVTLRFRLLDVAGRGVESERVSFALAGAPRSSTLRQLDATTDSDGAVSVVLVAGPMPTTFEVRATAAGAAPLLLEVSVGTEFGELEVVVRADITRPVDAYVVAAVADVPCGEVADTAGAGRRIGTELPSTRFPALSTSASWTVDVRGVTAAGHVVARGCVEGVRVAATAPTRSTVEVRDLPLRTDGAYAVSVTLEAGALGVTARRDTLGAAISDTGASLLLDGLRDELGARGTSDVAALRISRAAGLDARLALELELARATVPEELTPLADEVETGFGTLTLHAVLREGGAATVLEASGAEVGPASVAGPFDVSFAEIAVDSSRDVLLARGVDVRVGAASLFAAAFVERARARSPDGLAGLIRDGLACGTMLSVVTRERVLSACDPRCVRDACERAAATLEASMSAGAAALDDTHAAVRFDATVVMADVDADLRVDETTADGIVARWESLDGTAGTTLGARWSGTRDDALE